MIDISNERLLKIRQVCDRIPGKRGGVVYHTVWHWMHKGVGGVVLESVRLGGRVYTSEQALKRFMSALSGDGCDSDRTAAPEPVAIGEQRPSSSAPSAPRRGHEQTSARLPSESRRLAEVCRNVEQKYGLK